MASRLILVTGCSGGGKSTLIDALHQRGHATVPEPGRRIVAEERAGNGAALPWVDPEAFARRAVEMARDDLARAKAQTGLVFFDRGLLDAAVALHHVAGVPLAEVLGDRACYDTPVFLAPPWPDIYCTDADRQHDLQAATEEYLRIVAALDQLGYATCHLPRVDVRARVDFVLDRLSGRVGG